ncbi:MAG: hypothetical protein KatS3mg062_0471 [Tepidiforma sp.]|nr:MAG: hypothetical protein KatS3mg062_0471 [Tepidiforma sp.]
MLAAAPAEVVLVMTQEMARQAGANAIDVFDGAGNEVTVEEAQVDPVDRRRLTVRLPSSLPPGAYVVKWRTLSADDGDTATGELRFVIDPAATPSPGREVLQESLLGEPSPGAAAGTAGRQRIAGDDGGTGWVLAAALGAIGLVVGFGAGVVFSGRTG